MFPSVQQIQPQSLESTFPGQNHKIASEISVSTNLKKEVFNISEHAENLAWAKVYNESSQ